MPASILVPFDGSALAERAAMTMLSDYEREEQIDLVVMSAQSRGSLAGVEFGSRAHQLLSHGRAPLPLVRDHGTPSTLRRIVVPLDGSARTLMLGQVSANPALSRSVNVKAGQA